MLRAFGRSTIALALLAGARAASVAQARSMPEVASASQLKPFLDTLTDAASRVPCRPRITVTRDADTLSPHRAPGSVFIVSGTITAPDGSGATGARIELRRAYAQASAEAGGRYELRFEAGGAASPRSDTLDVWVNGAEAVLTPVVVRAGEILHVDAVLCPWRIGPWARSVEYPVWYHDEPGVEEPDIAAVSGQYLVVLRHGRLFTIRLGARKLELASAVFAFDRGVGQQFYSMFVVGDRVSVISSPLMGSTNIGLFRVARDGEIRHEADYEWVSPFDSPSYYHPPRLVGTRLIFYSEMRAPWWQSDPIGALPVLRRTGWHGEGVVPDTIAVPRRVFRPNRDWGPADDYSLHVVTTCDLAAPGFQCGETAALGPFLVMYAIKANAVYVLASRAPSDRQRRPPPLMDPGSSFLLRIPTDGSPPGMIGVTGLPVRLSTFTEQDAHVGVLLGPDASGRAWWSPAGTTGRPTLLDLPVTAFGDGHENAPAAAYRSIPRAEKYPGPDRFAPGFLLYGALDPDDTLDRHTALYAAPLRGGDITRLPMRMGLSQLAPMGRDVIALNSNGRTFDVVGIRLDSAPHVQQHYSMPAPRPREVWFEETSYVPTRGDSGVLGIQIVGSGRWSYKGATWGPGRLLLLLNDGRQLTRLALLTAPPDPPADTTCRLSCTDGLGRTRLIAAQGRLFALLGYDLVEFRVSEGRFEQVRRTRFTLRDGRTTATAAMVDTAHR